jgi:hypothetical protein
MTARRFAVAALLLAAVPAASAASSTERAVPAPGKAA